MRFRRRRRSWEFSWVNQNEIDEEVEKLSGGNLLRRYLNQKELEQSGVDLQIETAVDEAKVAEFVQTRCAEIYDSAAGRRDHA